MCVLNRGGVFFFGKRLMARLWASESPWLASVGLDSSHCQIEVILDEKAFVIMTIYCTIPSYVDRFQLISIFKGLVELAQKFIFNLNSTRHPCFSFLADFPSSLVSFV